MSDLLCMIPGPDFVLATADDDRETRWCFACRKHLKHSWELLTDAPEDGPSYYDRVPVLRCSRCKEDHTVHPGSYRDGPAWPSEVVGRALAESAGRTLDTDDYKRRAEIGWRKFKEESLA